MGFRDDLVSSSKEHSSRIVLALDPRDPLGSRLEHALRLVENLGDDLAGVKLHWHLLLPFGLTGISKVMEACADRGLPVIADLKLNDIESTNLEVVDLLSQAGVSAVIANPFVGAAQGLSAVIEKCRESGKGVILLVYMSHAGAGEGYGLVVDGKPLYLEFARRARDWDADGAIVSAKSPEIVSEVRHILRKDQLILSPGVGAQGGDAVAAIRAGTDYPIVGRSIIDSPDPKGILSSLNRSLSGL